MQSKSQIRSIGIDLGKTTFHLVALGKAFPGSNPQEVLTFSATSRLLKN
jgi:hypothetical protein